MFWLGFISGVVLTWLITRCCCARRKPAPVFVPRKGVAQEPPQEVWEQTRNFLYYDGTQMPLKEEMYE